MLRQIILVLAFALVAAGCSSEADSPAIRAEPAEPAQTASATGDVEPSVGPTPVRPADETALINWSESGVVTRSVAGELRTITTTPAMAAVLFDDGAVVYQTGPELILAVGDGLDREIRGDAERQMQLLDGRDVDGVRQILVASTFAMPVGPDDAEQRLLLIDIDSGFRYDLGQVGGWESSVFAGQFTDNTIGLMRTNEASFELVVLDHDGATLHETPIGTDGFFSLAALTPGDEIAVFKGGTVSLFDALTGQELAALPGEWPCLDEVWAGPTRFYCAQPDGPVRIAVNTRSASPLEWAPSGMVAPVVARSAMEVTNLRAQGRVAGLRQIGVSPDGAFRYFVEDLGTSQPRPILVDVGNGMRPAMNDPRDAYRLIDQPPLPHSLEFIDDTTVTWFSAWTMTGEFIGRIDGDGMIVDIAGVSDDIEDYEVLAVMTSGRDLEIDETAPVLDLMAEVHLPPPFTGGWFVGTTLSKKPACRGKTLYRTTADGYGRVLPATIEIDEPVAVDATSVFGGLNVDSVSTHRVVAVSVQCPGTYDGVRVHLIVELIGYGDGGPRSGPVTWPLLDGPIRLADGTETFAGVTGVSAVGRDCDFAQSIEIGFETLDGRQLVVEVSQWRGDDDGPLEPTTRTAVADESPDTILCETD